MDLEKLGKLLNTKERHQLSPYACLSETVKRRYPDQKVDLGYRQAFAVDSDRILHSMAYTRYIDKTQVFSLVANDHITHRALHVQLVSKIARTIGRCLSLNEDLSEAIALGHDIGHPPFGHDGEEVLSKICVSHGIGHFAHNVQSVHFLDRVERKGRGWNLSLQTMDGILCHDGEVHIAGLYPCSDKTFETHDQERKNKVDNPEYALRPMTMEGCLVRMADTIAYIGRDIEDAIRLKVIKRNQLPSGTTRILGNTNGTIVYHLVTDMIQSSLKANHVVFSPEVAQALGELKKFNYENIYLNPAVKLNLEMVEQAYHHVFDTCLRDLVQERKVSAVFAHFLKGMSSDYMDRHPPAAMVRDFVAGMTDRFFLNQLPPKLVRAIGNRP